MAVVDQLSGDQERISLCYSDWLLPQLFVLWSSGETWPSAVGDGPVSSEGWQPRVLSGQIEITGLQSSEEPSVLGLEHSDM